jgi:hypothetical protein
MRITARLGDTLDCNGGLHLDVDAIITVNHAGNKENAAAA